MGQAGRLGVETPRNLRELGRVERWLGTVMSRVCCEGQGRLASNLFFVIMTFIVLCILLNAQAVKTVLKP
ncbi:MAG: hypothetical protein NTV15_09225 [Candidatus Bathyarchaeota archaeon]|nr:hypothetical protein [Candidatus Bathyarchaeota archaeon]